MIACSTKIVKTIVLRLVEEMKEAVGTITGAAARSKGGNSKVSGRQVSIVL
jgi:hypothetical protein